MGILMEQHLRRPRWARVQAGVESHWPSASWVFSDKMLSLSEPQCSHLKNRNSIYL